MKELTEKSFQEALKKGTTVIDFWAPWCGPCKLMVPVFEEVGKQLAGISFAKINVDEHPEVASKNSVSSIPTTIVFKDGEEIDRRSGYMPVSELKRWLASHAVSN